jgi:MFS family permease
MNGNVRKSLRLSILDGICAAAAASVTDCFVIPFAIALQASTGHIASLVSLPNLVAAVAQLQAGPLKNWVGSRKLVLVAGVSFQALCIVGLAAVPFLPEAARLTAAVSLMVVFAVSGSLATPMWQSMMSEYLPLSKRSGYFGARQQFLGGVTVVATLAAGLALHRLHGNLRGFIFLFLGAAFVRLVCVRFLTQMFDRPRHHRPRPEPPTYRSCLTRNRPFVRFMAACGLMGVSVSLTGPFLSFYLLKELRLSYGIYTAVILAAQIAMFFMMGRWGRSADRAGNMKIIQLTARFLPFTVLLWIFSTHPAYLIGVQLFGGIVWAGYNLCVGNFTYDSIPTRLRVHATSLFATVNGLAAFAGAMIGGELLTVLPPIGGHRFYTLILIGAIARFGVGWFVFPRLREVRDVPATRSRELMLGVLRPLTD